LNDLGNRQQAPLPPVFGNVLGDADDKPVCAGRRLDKLARGLLYFFPCISEFMG